MDALTPGATVGVCVGVLGLVVLGAVIAVRVRRRQQAKSPHDDPEAGHVYEPVAVLVADEAQPLLSESAIRTRYASNPNEFASSFIDRPQLSSYVAPRSLVPAPDCLPYSPTENVVVVASCDSSDSSDSGIDSCASTHGDELVSFPPPNEEDGDKRGAEEPQSQPETGSASVSDSCERMPAEPDSVVISVSTIDCNCATATLVPTPALTPVTRSQPTGLADERGRSSSDPERELSVSVAESVVASAESGSAKLRSGGPGGRARSSTLSAQARAFVPGSRVPRVTAELADSLMRKLRPTVSHGDSGTAPLKRCDAQALALGPTVSGGESAVSDKTKPSKTESDRTESDKAESSKAASDTVFTPTRRCRFWPTCNNGNCKYAHPSITCGKFPNCAFGENCIFIHPSDAQKINNVISLIANNKRGKRKALNLVKLNNLTGYVG
ncbi:hypothetical protein GGI02_000623 [Coemansia sp. RSA 2322]|uniref:C3H1-type domain-containing protein n=1 Tax=Coemansia thaxteri TaxID=2663907 RepID=A0A9W8EL40_9FUNG|nr:hypothetical protein H4R26_001505 [Coemansia thaxteri]KAJ2473751.1 hypothetical protein GGI02_000623 [Coemansia sp. RSA 2322]KAJ2487239.1 hypothetical protein EV174_000646 [Coemansia sp. RSA 2320]